MESKTPRAITELIQKSIKKAGSQRALAKVLDCQHSTVGNWIGEDASVPGSAYAEKMREYLGESDTAEKPLVITDNGHWTKDQEIERLQQKMVKLQREHDEKERENKKLKAAFAKLKKTISTITGGD